MDNTDTTTWKKCTICKKSISFGARYYVCSVSTCTSERTGFSFCSVQCFDAHLPGARHRDAGAIEKMAPKSADAPSRVLVRPASTSGAVVNNVNKAQTPQEILVIASRLKEYIQARSEFNTSASVMDVLSAQLRILCDRAIDNARVDGRKTVLDRDFDFLKKN